MDENQTLIIQGVKVYFPAKPYPSQVAMMGQIVKGLKRGENCLLESPTGTGKSLALLCATLAWQAAEEDCVRRYNSLIDQGITDPDILDRIFSLASSGPPGRTADLPKPLSNQPQPINNSAQPAQSTTQPARIADPPELALRCDETHSEGGFLRDDDMNDFRIPSFCSRIPGEGISEQSVSTDESQTGELDDSIATVVPQDAIRPKKKRAPKIYFGTRTHKQIFQIIKELRKTEYRHVRSVVLGSRDHTCIHPIVSTSRNKSEGCKALLDHKEDDFCSFYHGSTRLSTHEQLANFGLSSAWDLEDLVKLGKKVKACPYFTARQLIETGQIIFCPYNYLIDPLIRKNMKIDLRNSVLVLDEAHNVEDSSREAASASLTQGGILEAKNDIEKLLYHGGNPDSCKPLIAMLSHLSQWMGANKENLTDYSEFGRTGKIFSGSETVEHLRNLDIDQKALSTLEGCLNQFSEDANSEKEADSAKPSAATSQLLSSFFLMVRFLLKANKKNVNDYKVALVRAQSFAKGFRKDKNSFISHSSDNFVYSLNFWCLNPGVVFSELGAMTRSIILTSGTLSPLNSFASELQVEFPVRLEANHVINQEQVWVGTIARGPTDYPLNATFKNTETWAFQDELGRMIMEVCEAVPRGVLCFLPSYAMLDKLVERWQSSLIWEQIEKTKRIFTEPRNVEHFENAMKNFYKTIKDTRGCTGEESLNGALFIAVCRGKVSEGLDFTDDSARAVIAIGIPYPNVKDIQVNLKREYNDTYSNTRGLLSGKQWYEIQAYRALNQALGRCIRHRSDWGAIILVDERYQKTTYGSNQYVNGLSRWVRNSLHHQSSFSAAISKLKHFARQMTQNPPSRSCYIPEPKYNPAMMETPKPKFDSPPVFRNSRTKEENGGNNADKVLFSPGLNFRPGLDTTNLLVHIKEGGTEATKPQSAILLTPVKDDEGFPLTPISSESPTAPQEHSAKIVYPLASTQKRDVYFPSDSNIKIIGFVNRQNACEENDVTKQGFSETSPYPAMVEVGLSFHTESGGSKSKESKEAEQQDCSDCYLSSDMFGEEECEAMESPLMEYQNESEKEGKKGNRKKTFKGTPQQKKNLSHTLSRAFDRVLTVRNTATSSADDQDSDLDDFNLDTSIVGSLPKLRTQKSKKRKRRSENGGGKKGVVFSEYS